QEAGKHLEFHGSKTDGFPAAWRETDPLPWLERRRDLGHEHHPLLRRRSKSDGSANHRFLCASLSVAGNATLWGRAGTRSVWAVRGVRCIPRSTSQSVSGAGTVGGEWNRAHPNHRGKIQGG